jgi:hypothetical protein
MFLKEELIDANFSTLDNGKYYDFRFWLMKSLSANDIILLWFLFYILTGFGKFSWHHMNSK